MSKEVMFTQTKIPLCGSEYEFRRCSNNALTEYDKKIQEKIKEIEPETDESNKLNNKTERLNSKIKSMESKINLLERKEDLSDKEIDKAMSYHDQLDELHEELEKHLENIKKFNEETQGIGEKLTEDINRITAEKMEAVLEGMTADFFLENADRIDWHIADNISKYYEMCMIGERPSKIKQEIKDDCDEFRKRQKGS